MAKASALNFGEAGDSVLTLLISRTLSFRFVGVIARCGSDNQDKSDVSACCTAVKYLGSDILKPHRYLFLFTP
jgi:hypothetical protein